MLKTDLIHILSDAIQQHEGWITTGGTAWSNLNPGNLDFAGQAGAIQNGRWAKFDTFFDGKQALNNDIAAKMTKLNTIRDIITEYAPSSENDTEAYIASVCAFLLSRNVVLNPDSPIDAFLSQCQTPVNVITFNHLYEPVDWASNQASIVEVAKLMPEYAFSCRYSDVTITPLDVTIIDQPLISARTSVLSLAVTKSITATYNVGQPINILVFDGSVMQGEPTAAGGCEWQGQSVNTDPVTSFASVMYQGPAFTDATARLIFHEIIHELFSITKQADTLHADLIAARPNGYAQNLAVDLEAVFNGNHLNTPAAVSNLEAAERSLT